MVIGALTGVDDSLEAPDVGDEFLDQEALGGVGGSVLRVVFGGEMGVILSGFIEHELFSGEGDVLHGVEAGYSLILDCAGSSRF